MYERIDWLRERLRESGADAILVSQPNNRRYLTGFTGHDSPSGSSAGWLLVTASEATLLAGFLSLEQARREAPSLDLRDTAGKPAELLGVVARERGFRRLLCEGSHLTHAGFLDIQSQLPASCELAHFAGWIEQRRAIKDDGELESIRQAARLTDAALNHILSVIRPGMNEKEIAWEAESYMRSHGAEAMAFEVGVATGPNTSLPHNPASDRRLREGDAVWIDMGAQFGGYCADLTRTFCLGRAEPRLREIWDLVLDAQQEAIKQCRAGMSGRDVDAIARRVIAEAGYATEFGHGLGHGVGLVVHEQPRLSQLTDDTLAVGNVVTFEPGVYLEGWAGVRIEDLGVIRDYGVELISFAPRSLELG
ncbi:MAG: M24 family metallopeptidase [Chloroflexota bacterium]